MRFSCERCGKKYATADTPAPGKVYKLKCKACGHLIVVRAPGGTSTALPVQPEASTAGAPGAVAQGEPPPEVPLEIGAPERAPPGNGAPGGSSQVLGEGTAEVAVFASVTPTPVPQAAPPEEEFRPPPGDSGYVDLFSDIASGASELPAKHEDPFVAAARASLPEGYGGTSAGPDPHAPPREDPAPAPPAHAAPPIPRIPVIPKPPPQKSGLPIALIGAGVVVLVGILAFVLWGSGKKAPAPTSPRAAVQAAAPIPPPPPAPPAPEPPVAAPAPAPAPVEAAPQPEAKRPAEDDRRRREERRRRDRDEAQAAKERDRVERERRARQERDARERDAKERDRKERERLAAAAVREEGEGGLTQAQIEVVLRSTKKAFDGCLQSARGTESMLDGRRVMLRLNIQPSGTVTYPTLDDVTLNSTEVGSCLKSAARLMVFPKFKGDTMHVEVPLVMR